MTRVSQLLEGKFKNISFKVRSERMAELGQKYVQHDYFNSGARYMEPQGEEPETFSVDVFFSGANYQDDFKRFRAALRDPAPGTLILPTFGVFTSMIGYDATAEASQTAVGEIKLPVKFTKTINRPSPSSQVTTAEDVSAQAEVTRQEVSAAFENAWETPTTVNNITTASTDLKALARDLAGRASSQLRNVQQFVRRVDNSLRSAGQVTRLLMNTANPIGLLQNAATTITGTDAFRTFQFIATIGATQPNTMANINAVIRPTGSTGVVQPEADPAVPDVTVPLWDSDTTEREQRNTNRALAVNIFRMVGLIGMYESASTQRYTTTDDIDSVRRQLDLYYSLLIEDDTTGVLIPNIKTEISRLRGLLDEVLKRQRQNAFSVVEINVPMYTPVTLLTYDLYGERIQTEAELNYLADILKGLNQEMPAHRLYGTVRVIEIR